VQPRRAGRTVSRVHTCNVRMLPCRSCHVNVTCRCRNPGCRTQAAVAARGSARSKAEVRGSATPSARPRREGPLASCRIKRPRVARRTTKMRPAWSHCSPTKAVPAVVPVTAVVRVSAVVSGVAALVQTREGEHYTSSRTAL